MLNNQEISAPVLIEDLGMLFPNENSKRKYRYGIFKCYCGNEFKASVKSQNRCSSKSCGCYASISKLNNPNYHGFSNTKIYQAWSDIKQRCFNKKCNSFIDYGGRGITVCEEWRNDFMSFYNWAINNGYEEKLSIDRINNNGNYEPSNCRWTTTSIQNRNTRILSKRNKSGYRGVSYCNKYKKYSAYITIKNKPIRIGSYKDPKDAAIAYDTFVIVYGLEHTTNFPKGIFEK